MFNPFAYDFAYSWPFSLGHAVAFSVFTVMAAVAWWRGWPRWTIVLTGALGLWALVGAIVLTPLMRLPMQVPTSAFLRSGEGRVLDMGAGSGRSTVGVLLSRPKARVTALDRYTGYYGIDDNTPERLRANARAAGAEDRVEVKVGDMREMPFEASTFDGVVSAYAIDHLGSEGVTRALSEASRVLRPQGEFLLIIVNVDGWARVAFPWGAVHGHGYFGRPQDPNRWTNSLTAAGFDVVEYGTTLASQYFLCRKKV